MYVWLEESGCSQPSLAQLTLLWCLEQEYCVCGRRGGFAQRTLILSPDLLHSVLESMDVEITLFKGIVNWTQSRIILLFNRQTKPGGHTPVDLFPLEQVTLWALQIALMIAIRSHKPEEYLLHYCPLTRYETTSSGLSSHQDIPGEACTIVRVTARATGVSSNTDRTPFFSFGQSMAKGA